MSEKRLHHQRRFLNREGAAFVETSIYVDTIEPTKRHPQEHVSIPADFTIADCNRIVTLEFGMWEKGDIKRRLRKARLLKSLVDNFVEALEKAADEHGGRL